MLKMQDVNRIIWKAASIVPIVIAATLLMGCSTPAEQSAVTEDPSYLTPIPQETLQAYEFDTPVRNKMDAVIAARLSLSTTRLNFTETPKVISVEEMKLSDARRRAAQPGINTYEDRPGDTMVWLVIFEGEWSISGPPTDPANPATMEPPSHGCVFVIVDANDSSRSDVGTIFCIP